MNSIKIQIPEGFEVENFDQSTGEIKFREKATPRINRISTFEQVCAEMNVDPMDYGVTELHPQRRGLQIMKRLMLIAECFQEGTEFDLYNTNQRKWYPWFAVDGESGFRFVASSFTRTDSRAVLGPLLQFQSREVSTYVGQTFIAEYRALAELSNKSK